MKKNINTEMTADSVGKVMGYNKETGEQTEYQSEITTTVVNDIEYMQETITVSSDEEFAKAYKELLGESERLLEKENE